MSYTSLRLQMPFLAASQAQKHVTHNEAIDRLDSLVQTSVEAFDAEVPEAFPQPGALYALGASPTGAWAGRAGALARWDGTAWQFLSPSRGWRAWGGEPGEMRVFDGLTWTRLLQLANLDGIGIGTAWDPVNRLVIQSEAALFTHTGAGHQIKVNKSRSSDTASLLFQTDYSTRAELGLVGDDDLTIKVSADGIEWTEALRMRAATGEVDLAPGSTVGGAPMFTPGNLTPDSLAMASGSGDAIALTTAIEYGSLPPGLRLRFRATTTNTGASTINLDGTGPVAARTVLGWALPAGYVRTDRDTVATYNGSVWILEREAESGSNANGEFIRLADGRQICWGRTTTSSSAAVSVVFAAQFALSTLRVTTGVNAAAAFAIAPTFTALTAIGMSVSAWRPNDTRVATQVEYSAFGRWY